MACDRPSTRALIVMPLGTQRGGAELMLQHLLEHRHHARLDPTVAFLEPGPLVDWCVDNGVPTFVIGAGRVRQPRMVGRTVRALVRAATEQRSEVVIGWMSKAQLYGGPAAALARVPSVWLQAGLPSGIALFDRAATALPTALVVTLSRIVERAQHELLPRRPTALVYPAVDTDRFDADRIGDKQSTRRRLGLPADVPIFGSVGRLDRWKGFDTLLDASPAVLRRHPDATLVLVGGPHEFDPTYAHELSRRAKRLGRDGQIRLVGSQPNPEEWMQAMDVFVHTSRLEPFGMVVIEAMSLGKPVVASAEGGPTEVITPGVDGFLSPFGDQRALAAAVAHLLDDDRLRRSVGQAARARARDFTVQRFAQEFGAAVAGAVGQ
jgi:glycosyltransferase involved in cell wall biosynthesis